MCDRHGRAPREQNRIKTNAKVDLAKLDPRIIVNLLTHLSILDSCNTRHRQRRLSLVSQLDCSLTRAFGRRLITLHRRRAFACHGSWMDSCVDAIDLCCGQYMTFRRRLLLCYIRVLEDWCLCSFVCSIVCQRGLDCNFVFFETL